MFSQLDVSLQVQGVDLTNYYTPLPIFYRIWNNFLSWRKGGCPPLYPIPPVGSPRIGYMYIKVEIVLQTLWYVNQDTFTNNLQLIYIYINTALE